MRLPTFLLAAALAAASALPVQAAPDPSNQPGTAEYTPDGAPRDDYNFVAWCQGVLEGHMALAEHVQSVLPLDEAQQKIGNAYLRGYEQALQIGKKGRSEAELDAAQAIRHAARANWNTAMGADLQLGADTYLAWQLPGRCEHAAKRVAKRDDIFQMAPGNDDLEAVGTGVAQAPAAAPAAASPAPSSTAEPLSAAGPVGQTWMTSETPATESAADATPAGGATVMPDESTPAEAAPATVAAAEPAPAPTPAADSRTASDGKVVHMPRKGRLFPWGRRE
ncbi:MAG: hypothetical protein K1X35_03070 [Caulobacteraceae bacterium]|nr:hypothetical protein [Caulobacteraceae bacterium]